MYQHEKIITTFCNFIKSFQNNQEYLKAQLTYDPEAKVILTGINENVFNSVFLKQPQNYEALINELVSLHKRLDKPLTVWLPFESNASELEGILKERFYSPGPFQGMLLELDQANLMPQPEAVTIEQVSTEAQARDYAQLFCSVFGMAGSLDHAIWWTKNTQKPGKFYSKHYLAKINGELAGGCSLLIDNTWEAEMSGGLYNAAVLPPFRYSGLGTAMACHRLKVAATLGVKNMSLVLKANAMARGYCERLGFKQYQSMTPYFVG